MSIHDHLKVYAQKIRDLRRASAEVPETALAPAFQQLLEGLIPLLAVPGPLVVVPEFHSPGVGRPDIALKRTGAPARAFVELKAPGKSADPARWKAHDQRQFGRFQELPCWMASNFVEARLFFRKDEQAIAQIVPEACLKPDRDDTKANKAIAAHDPSAFVKMIEALCGAAGQEPVARDAEHLAELMAHSARLVRGIVRDRLAELHEHNVEEHALLQVRQEFRDVLYAHPEAAGYKAKDFDELFSGAFAQTLAFGLLLVREASGKPVDEVAWKHMPEEHPLMRTALRVLSQDEVIQDMGVGFDVMRDTVNSFAPEILAIAEDGRDPILYFYEDFLKTFDPDARKAYGVYYTPLEVVEFMVGALDHALRDDLDTGGLGDDGVTVLDPATGTGTFLLGVAQRVREQAAEGGAGMAEVALRDLAKRMYGFEMLVGPYAVAHYRLHHMLAQGKKSGKTAKLPRLGVYLADTLAEPNAAAPTGALGFVAKGISDERREANRIKAQQQILAIIGNPPYRRLEEGENRTLLGNWMDGLWDDLKEPVRNAGHGNQLNTFPELSVAFWRWAIWKLFEADNAPKRGVVAFITNRKFLTGWPYAGLRQLMRQRFDRIDIFDLRGDVRRGERAGVEDDQGVFNIQVGTAITIAVADGSKEPGAEAQVFYTDSWAEGLFSRKSKLARLRACAADGVLPNPVAVERDLLDDMRPEPFQNGEWVSLRDIFSFSKSGMKSGDDDTFTHPRKDILIGKIQISEKVTAYNASLLRNYSYRPLDHRWFYNDLSLLNRPGPQMQKVWGARNVGLYAMPFATGQGPAVWCHGLLPDYHAFSGRGGYAFPLFDHRPEVNAANIAPGLIAGLNAAYGIEVTPREVFDAILCILSARSYSLRFAEELEDTFPHVLFPAGHAIFAAAAELGAKIRGIETFAIAPSTRGPDFIQLETAPTRMLASVSFQGQSITLCADGSGHITGLPQDVWDFSVSGYRVLPRWLEGRQGLSIDQPFLKELKDICGRIAELIDLFAKADIVLDNVLKQPLIREALGFAPVETDDGPD